ncbi:5-methyltetrahydropteroyltriglutamate--homocysteine S-methyltransferase [Amorphus orientalis]|uniref:5-methyltetrahydropteroyltriglutamate--homocysteine methyltransferase n=1 Tax=Amorphus orientalis TaxID=649198 RepID=A0AAE3VL50_9HYPH|nr:5-methyltetrahydropteroyltriglutamate--homocysteine S-methyltransferase [Amorphus orientalis]MDQ0313701.1 5-methyltetrahydropteroyltriglutamate--homocysteine methyltransferase [Amorphus orientalis]
MTTKAPFRADEVGSLLRPQRLKEARAAREAGTLDAAGLKAVEDECIREIVKRQEEVGLKAVTDGEFRRSWWHFDFMGGLEGVEVVEHDQGIQFSGVQTKSQTLAVKDKVAFGNHYMIDHFRFLKEVTSVEPKMTIPSPTVLHFRGGRRSISKDIYPDLDAFFADTAEAYAQAIKAFYDAGCRYLQFDDTVWAYLCSEKEMQAARDRGEETDGLQQIYADMINHALKAKPADMTITTHVCRGNFRSSWISEGGYEPVAETLLSKINYDGYFLEYDSDRAGGFEPLRFLPKGDKRVVLGLITSKSGDLESREDVLKRIEEASKFAPKEQFCLSPQCGFASTEEGNILTEEQQWAKLGFVVDVAKEVWGEI